ncbi:hypothetical protein B7463_g8807, partial [Scytalidium lignicola]
MLCLRKAVLRDRIHRGGNSGIGYATAASLIASPTYHVIIGSRSLEKGQTALATLSTNVKGSISLIQLDVTDSASISAAVAKVEKEHERLDVLINNAAIGPTSPSLSVDLLRETFESNVFGVAGMTDLFVPLLRKSSDLRLIHVSSGVGSLRFRAGGLESRAPPFPPFYAYSMSKGRSKRMIASRGREAFWKERQSTHLESPDYDYAVVGAGIGGGPVAANLAIAGYKVLLLDAGDDEGTSYQERVPTLQLQATDRIHPYEVGLFRQLLL